MNLSDNDVLILACPVHYVRLYYRHLERQFT
ncbi:hypothetical protein DFR44_10845 [Hydromonas duriensis]|uniref:Uncharacterized protein n=1 Tax=Hydromonas duriensis TaxID=1527608 RepID=A0A4R6Y8E8_9BURK|nr:hypothetical protein DFR44_10845 [Hydromonas duriensis]